MNYDFEFRSRRSNVLSTRGIAASSQPLASLAGLDTLRKGGNAADAAVAVAAALNVVEPFSTGLGGDCFALYWDSKTKKVYGLNSSGPAPKSATISALTSAGYKKYPLYTGHAVSVPGTVAGWDALLNRFGTLSLRETLESAIRYALEGFPVTEWIGSLWKLMAKVLLRDKIDKDVPRHLQRHGPPQPSGREFLLDGRAPEAGEIMTLTTLGETLKAISEGGKDIFYKGDLAERICRYTQKYGGWLETSDLADYEPEWVEPITADYRGVQLHECPPNGQGLAAIIAVKIASAFDLAKMDMADRTHIMIECMRLGFSEALQWVSDPHFAEIPYEKLISEEYIHEKQQQVSMKHAIKYLTAGTQPVGEDTVYLSVIDGEGNACSFINSLYRGGGSGLVVPGTGIFLQNRAALFSLDPEHPNALEGGKRPYHTIIPAMLTKDGELFGSYGIMGGFMQPQAHLQVLSNLVDYGQNPQQSLDMPRFCLNVDAGGGVGALDPGGEVWIEKGFSFDEMASLTNRGHRLSPLSGLDRIYFGGGQVILRNPETGVMTAGSDPRKDGCAIGW